MAGVRANDVKFLTELGGYGGLGYEDKGGNKRRLVETPFDPLTGGIEFPGLADGVPLPVGKVIAFAHDAAAFVTWPASALATSYTVTASTGETANTQNASVVFSGLSNGVSRTFSVVATNAYGQSPVVVSKSVTPTALPGDIAGVQGLCAWFDASQITGLENGAAIPSWPDFSGNNNAATQATIAQRPTYAASWLTTGKPAVQFDGASANGDNLVSSLTPKELGPDATIFVVFSVSALINTSGARDQRVIGTETRRYDKGFALSLSDTNLGGGGNSYACVRGGTIEIQSGSAFGLLAINTPYLVSVVTGAQFFINGNRQTPAYAGVASLLPRNQGFSLGGIANFADDQGLKGFIAEVMIFRGRLSDANRYLIESYLSTKYGMAAPAQQAVAA